MLILKNCRELLTVKEDAKDLIGLMENASVLIKGERIEKIGSYEDLIKFIDGEDFEEIDCSGKVVMPGYVDSHTHLLFGKSRVDEYVASLTNSSVDVKKIVKLVGLEASIYYTKKATNEELLSSSLEKLNRMLLSGTTTVEIKSGYGIDKDTELRQLRLINKLKEKTPQTILSTYLGAHFFDVNMGKEKYIDFMVSEVLPIIYEEKLANFSDIWVDDGYYTAEDADRFLGSCLDFGLVPTLHSECYSAIGGAKVAAKLKAANIGHLNYLTRENASILAKNNVVGIVIPTTDFSVKHPKPFDPSYMIEEGMTLAIATNLNPGNWFESMDLAMALACRNHKMSEKYAIRAATLNGAKALRIEKDFGSIEVGKYADIQIRDSDSYKNVVYKIGVNEVVQVIKKGKKLFK
ncbi:imidazolonepropionase [Peptoniphilus sp. AGMB00490]|uniref:Imidazolonepropionase n=1 Tax=Peptoniphilus faecalis TaxID=2731255 RepID=A0A848RN14_9FIRM|nr:imidazolonepropionase [Peptoniphilus faecalis]NMW85672.1 imidazolonepropionase [Peptoniphilus faecalis]